MGLSTQRSLKLFSLVLIALFLASCSGSKEKVEKKTKKEQAETVESLVSSIETDRRKPVFVYKNQTAKTPDEVTLRLNAEPLLLVHPSPQGEGGASGYVRLVGVVSGGKPLALIEVGGRGVCLALGDDVAGYRLVDITKKGVKLLRKTEG